MFSHSFLGILRFLTRISAFVLIPLSQAFWLFCAWRLLGKWKRRVVRNVLRGAIVAAFGAVMVLLWYDLTFRGHHVVWRSGPLLALSGLWVMASVLAFLAVLGVAVFAWLWRQAERAVSPMRRGTSLAGPVVASDPVNPGRRRFFRSASTLAGAFPLVLAAYGFAIERLEFQVRRTVLSVAGLPPELEGLRIAQLSDIHIGSYMTAVRVRRAVEMANRLRPDLAVVTGDFLTRASDPLEACVAELSGLRAPLGVWGCNGNHEIYADAEALAARLFRLHGMTLLRQENAELLWNGGSLNLIGVDYERRHEAHGAPMLTSIAPLVRPGTLNLLLSHNPNTFPRAAELGIQLMLTGHTHGGQVKVEILDHRISPARFFTPYVAGMYRRPLGVSSHLHDEAAWTAAPNRQAAIVYVNRGLGTIVAPIRLGVPPEISLLTLHRA